MLEAGTDRLRDRLRDISRFRAEILVEEIYDAMTAEVASPPVARSHPNLDAGIPTDAEVA
jgi:hypothetical protein